MASKKKTEQKEAVKEEVKATRKKIAAIPTRLERAAAFKESFNASMKGRSVLMSASEYMLPFMYRRVPTGLLTLDAELKGGFPCGGISQIKGPKNVGKSWMACQLIRQIQSILGEKTSVLMAMTEMRFDKGQAKNSGVHIDMGKEMIIEMDKGRVSNGKPPFTKEEVAAMRYQVGNIDELHSLSAEDFFDGILKAVEDNAYQLIVIDSFGSILTAAQQEDDMAAKSYGGSSGPITTFLKKLAGLLTFNDSNGKVRDVCIIGINQVRDNIGGDANKPWRTTGGRALEHALFVDLLLAPGPYDAEQRDVMTADGKKKIWVNTGKFVNWTIEKGKAGIHDGGKGNYVYDFGMNNVNFYADTLVAGIREGIVAASGAWYSVLDPNNPGSALLQAQGKAGFANALSLDFQQKVAEGRGEDAIFNKIRSEVFSKNNIDINYDWVE